MTTVKLIMEATKCLPLYASVLAGGGKVRISLIFMFDAKSVQNEI